MRALPHYQPTHQMEEMGGPEGEWYFFYGGIFSNFAHSPVTIVYKQPWHQDDPEPAYYHTIEHFFQASKAAAEYDHEKIRRAENPGMAKLLGNQRQSLEPNHADRPLLRADWEDVKYTIMLRGVQFKFRVFGDMRRRLLDTYPALIAEDSPSDFIWGIRDGSGGFTGQNLLGKALTQVREEFRTSHAG